MNDRWSRGVYACTSSAMLRDGVRDGVGAVSAGWQADAGGCSCGLACVTGWSGSGRGWLEDEATTTSPMTGALTGGGPRPRRTRRETDYKIRANHEKYDYATGHSPLICETVSHFPCRNPTSFSSHHLPRVLRRRSFPPICHWNLTGEQSTSIDAEDWSDRPRVRGPFKLAN